MGGRSSVIKEVDVPDVKPAGTFAKEPRLNIDTEAKENLEGKAVKVNYLLWFLILAILIGFILKLAKVTVGSFVVPFCSYCGFCVYVLSVFEAVCLSKAGKYLRNVMNPDASLAYIDSLRNGVPSITFRMVCYHYEDQGKKKGQKVVSKEVTQKFPLRGYTDETISGISAQKALSAAQVSLALGGTPLVFHPRCRLTKQAIDSARRMFFDQNRSDKYQDEFDDHTIDDVHVKKHVLLAMDARPHWMNSCGLFLSAIVGCSACYRRALYANVCKTEVPVTKHISIFTPDQWDAEPMNAVGEELV